MTRNSTIKARQMNRPLKADEDLSDPQTISALNISRPCVERIHKRFVLNGLEKALNEDPQPGQ